MIIRIGDFTRKAEISEVTGDSDLLRLKLMAKDRGVTYTGNTPLGSRI